MQPDETKAQGLLRLLAQGLLAHAQQETARQLGDRSRYVGMSDIGKGMQCLRAAVAGKLGLGGSPAPEEARALPAEELPALLRRQITLQRGHWLEHGIEAALAATGVRLVPQLTIRSEVNGVPIRAHLDLTLVWGGPRPAVRILELKSTGQLPDPLHAAYEAQVYGQIGLLTSCWSDPCFSVQGSGHQGLSFPQVMRSLLGVELPNTPDGVDIEAWVLCFSMTEVKPFGPYPPDQGMLALCLRTAQTLWQATQEVRSGRAALNDLPHAQGFHPLCDWCEINADCPRFQGLDVTGLDSAAATEMEELLLLKEQRDLLARRVNALESRIRHTFRLASRNGPPQWLTAGHHRFRVTTVAGRTTLDRALLLERLTEALNDGRKAQETLALCEKSSAPFERLVLGRVTRRSPGTKADTAAPCAGRAGSEPARRAPGRPENTDVS